METTDELPAEVGAELVLGRYRLGRRLGSGGFGTVYAATDERLQRAVAVKVIPGAPDRGERGRREALAAGRLDHPGVVAVFDAGEDSRARYLVSELVHGRTLDELSAEGVLSDRDVLRIGLALCGALEHAHGRGVVHRDVKPQNVIVPDAPRSAAGVAKLADFGVAHLAGDEPLTRTGDVVGTLAYMAPEQAAGKRVDERCDLYSLALVLYEALGGRQPGPRRLARRDRAPRRHRRCRRCGAPARTCRRSCAPRSTARCARKPDERGTLDELAAELAESLPGGLRRGRDGRAAPARAHRAVRAAAARRRPRRGRRRSRAGCRRPRWPGPGEPLLPALAAVAAVARPPADRLARHRGRARSPCSPTEQPGAAVLVAAAALPVPLLLRRRGTAWSVPALAPLLGLVALAGAYPALAGRARGPLTRAALGALGAWWALLAAPLLGERSSARGRCPYSPIRGARAASPSTDAALDDVIAPLLTSGALLYAALWALAALLLPWLVRGRWLAADVVAGVGLGRRAGRLQRPRSPSRSALQSHAGWSLGAVLAGVIAVAVPHLRGVRVVEP